MKIFSRDSWARFGFEGGLIVISILVAFSIESWRSEHALAVEEQQILLQLQAEFEANNLQFEKRRKAHNDVLLAAEWVLSVTGPGPNREEFDASTFHRNVYLASDWFTFDPHMGALSSLVQSGKLGIISSDSLRNRLAAWPVIVDDIREDEIASRNFSLGPLTAYLVEHGSLRNVRFAGAQTTSVVEKPGASRFPSDMNEVLSDPVFENLIAQKLWLTTGVIREYDYLRTVIDEILVLLREEIQK